ncbi:EcsC family protein [Bacillaceae bacterium SIJ1]|uniref:EcsC family protein n=1 Tax=Litoribacterium kuwaitense TaxID=1398745 RepID=UPI0013EA1674|nr:EcsC family protein [Litoribacterium kuwaitense]NGP44841.1 EcsC family protein [Litoribacterium kuwaitense]
MEDTRYLKYVLLELRAWEQDMLKKSSWLHRTTKSTQVRLQALIPEKAHQALTDAVRTMTETCLTGSKWTTKPKDTLSWSLEQKDQKASEVLRQYKKSAAIEGAGTGAGGILLGLADFPLLLGIKMKCLFEMVSWYGLDTRLYEERLFILHLFQLAFSSDSYRKQLFPVVKHWNQHKERLKETDWRAFQQEYRDHIDLVKMMQMLPGVGAIVGAYANYNLLDVLGKTTVNGCRFRILAQEKFSEE